jgi:hypothetical protein
MQDYYYYHNSRQYSSAFYKSYKTNSRRFTIFTKVKFRPSYKKKTRRILHRMRRDISIRLFVFDGALGTHRTVAGHAGNHNQHILHQNILLPQSI